MIKKTAYLLMLVSIIFACAEPAKEQEEAEAAPEQDNTVETSSEKKTND